MTGQFERRPRPVSAQDLEKLAFFSKLDEATRDAVARLAAGIEYGRGRQIVAHLEDSQYVYFILEGSVRVDVYAPNGRHVTYELLGAGQMFGELAAIDGAPRAASCEAETCTWVARLSDSDFRDLRRRLPDLAEAVILRLAGLVRDLCEKVYEAHALPVRDRIGKELVRYVRRASRGAGEVEVDLNDALFASQVGTTREAVNRFVAGLIKLGMVDRHRGRLRILDVRRLEAYCAQELQAGESR